MTWRANLAAKTVIVASSVLESMITNMRAKESEVQDIANSVIDGVDAIQLGPETCIGQFADKSTIQLAKTCAESEITLDYAKNFEDIKISSPVSYGTAESAACAAVQTSTEMNLPLIVVLTESGNAAKLIAKYRPKA